MLGLGHVPGATIFKKMTLATESAQGSAVRSNPPAYDLLRRVCWIREGQGNCFEYFGRDGDQRIPFVLRINLASAENVQVAELGAALRVRVSNVAANNMHYAMSQLGHDLLKEAGAASGGEKLAVVWYQGLQGDLGQLTIAVRNVENGTVVD